MIHHDRILGDREDNVVSKLKYVGDK